MKKFVFFGLILFVSLHCLAQNIIDPEKTIFYRNEYTLSAAISSTGYSMDFQYAKQINAKNKHLFKFKTGLLRDDKEYRQKNYIYSGNRSFVFGKLNSFWSTQFLYGKQKTLFTKKEKQSIAIRIYTGSGISIGYLKPVYYQVIETVSDDMAIIYSQKFNENIHGPEDIYSRETFFKGLNETTLNPGICAEFGFNFEFSKKDKYISSFDTGLGLELYAQKVNIMANEYQSRFFFSLYLSYRFGKVVSPLGKALRTKEKLQEL